MSGKTPPSSPWFMSLYSKTDKTSGESARSDDKEYVTAENKKNKQQERLQLDTIIDRPIKRMTIPGGSNKITAVSATKGMANLPSAVRTLNVAAILTQEDKPDPLLEKINGPIWNLKGSTVDNILKDLDILKNDPDFQYQLSRQILHPLTILSSTRESILVVTNEIINGDPDLDALGAGKTDINLDFRSPFRSI